MNKTQLAAELGLNRGTLKAHLQKSNAPLPDKAGLYDLAAVSVFVESEQAQDNNSQSPELLKERIEKLRLQNSLLRKQLAEQGDSIALSQLQPFCDSFLQEVYYGLVGTTNALPPKLVGLSDREMLSVFERQYHVLLDTLGRWLVAHNITVKLPSGKPAIVRWPAKALAWWHGGKREPMPTITPEVGELIFRAMRELMTCLPAESGAAIVAELEETAGCSGALKFADWSPDYRKEVFGKVLSETQREIWKRITNQGTASEKTDKKGR
jgi:hypothetical protein